MTAFDDALVTVVCADYIGVDPSGKFNLIGYAFLATAVQPTGNSAPMYALAICDLPTRYAGRQVTLTLELFDTTERGSFRMLGASGRPEALRLEQMTTVASPMLNLPGYQLPPDFPCRIQMMMGFPTGLPLKSGHSYEWRASVEHSADLDGSRGSTFLTLCRRR